jgi:hypothetical protein
MTEVGIYERQNTVMLNFELARIIQADREREIEAGLRKSRLLRAADSTEDVRGDRRPILPTQRRASTGAVSR